MDNRYTYRRKLQILKYLASCTPYEQEELMRIHSLSHSEIAYWQYQVMTHGMSSLKSTKTQQYRGAQ